MATKTLGTMAVGSTIKLKESGKLVEFYVAKHDYESALNGTGRTLVVRKDIYDKRAWHSLFNVNTYATCDLDEWFNSTYTSTAYPRTVIRTTEIVCQPFGNTSGRPESMRRLKNVSQPG